MTNWHTIELDKSSTKNNICANVEIGKTSQWFSGHFPDEPILPGFALLSMVFDSILLTSKEELALEGFKKIRFKQVIKPGDRLKIKAQKQKNTFIYSFTVHANGIQACTGTLMVDRFKKKC
jgi:3-hydroxyacyl-[acyl-carrier-protein] dehydratase